MFVFRKIWHALLFCTSVLRIALLPYYRRREALRDLVPFVQFKKSENTNGEVLLLVKLQLN